jgi:hypothetical protein
MKFVSHIKNYRICVRPEYKTIVNTVSGGQDVIRYRPLILEFTKSLLDTKDWRQYTFADQPDYVNIIKKEDDLIKVLKSSNYYGIDFKELYTETRAERRARVLKELELLDAENDDESIIEEESSQEEQEIETEANKVIAPKRPAAKAKSKSKPKGKVHSKVEI